MIISNPFVFPILVLSWSIEAWLWLASIKLILEKVSPNHQLVISIGRLVDSLSMITKKLLSRCIRKELPQWLLWIITFFVLIIARHLLITLIVAH